jgi:hypothetical protein
VKSKLQITIDDDLLAALKERAATDDRSVAATIRVAIRQYMGYNPNHPPASSVPVRAMHIPESETESTPLAGAVSELMQHWADAGKSINDTASQDETMGTPE